MFRKKSIKQHIHRNSGFTLVELVVSMTLTAIFATAIVAVLPAATRIFMQMEDMSRAQVVADMVVDALREECADTYIENFASVRIVEANPSKDGDEIFIAPLRSIVTYDPNNDENFNITLASKITIAPQDGNGNVLIIQKGNEYLEAIYSDITISTSNYKSVFNNDKTAGTYQPDPEGKRLGLSSRAVYRFFYSTLNETIIESSSETLQGYIHYGYYSCASKQLYCDNGNKVSPIFPKDRYDYTNPFTNDAYKGYTVSLEFSDLKTTAGITSDLFTQRPVSVIVTVKVYKCGYDDQAENAPIYTRRALLVFSEDTTND